MSLFDPRFYFLHSGEGFVVVLLVFDNMCFCSNSRPFIDNVEEKLREAFEVMLYGALEFLISSSVTQSSQRIKVDQQTYVQCLLDRFGPSR